MTDPVLWCYVTPLETSVVITTLYRSLLACQNHAQIEPLLISKTMYDRYYNIKRMHLPVQQLCDIEALVHDLITNYNRSLNDIINSQAPLLHRTITLRPHAPLYTDTLRDAKRKRRQLEHRWRSTKLEVHHHIYRDFCVVVNKSLRAAKSEYYENHIKLSRYDTKAMFRT